MIDAVEFQIDEIWHVKLIDRITATFSSFYIIIYLLKSLAVAARFIVEALCGVAFTSIIVHLSENILLTKAIFGSSNMRRSA